MCVKVEGDEMEEVARDLIAPPSEEESGEDEEEGELEGDATNEKSSIRKYRCVEYIILPPPYSTFPGVFWLISRRRSVRAKMVLATWRSLGRMRRKTLQKQRRNM